MKRNYEDLQKEIDALNSLLGKVKVQASDLDKRLDNEDREKDNDLKNKIQDKIAECDRDINGDKASDDRDPTKPQHMLARKKEIITAINKMVNQFNDNNKLIKELSKGPKTEKEMNDLMAKNQEI